MRAKRIDANQPEIVDHLRAIGWGVHITAPLGGGFSDLVVTNGPFAAFVEIKDGDKPPSARKLTKDELVFQANCKGIYLVVTSPADAQNQLEAAREEAWNENGYWMAV